MVRFCIIILFMLNLRNYIWLIQKKFWLYSLIQKHWKIQKYKFRKIGIKKAMIRQLKKDTELKKLRYGIKKATICYSSKRKKIWQFI